MGMIPETFSVEEILEELKGFKGEINDENN